MCHFQDTIGGPKLLAHGGLKIKDSSMSLKMNIYSSQSSHNIGGETVVLVNSCNILTKSLFRATSSVRMRSKEQIM